MDSFSNNEKLIIRKNNSLNKILVESKKAIPKIEEGQVFETMVSIYPNSTVLPCNKNILINESRVTVPKAFSSKAKKQNKKRKSFFCDFYKEGIKGDFLIVEKIIDDETFYCKNISLLDESIEKYYSSNQMRYIRLTKDDILNGNIKRVYRGYKTHLNKK